MRKYIILIMLLLIPLIVISDDYLKQSNAVTILIGPFLDLTDLKTLEPLLDVTQIDVKFIKSDFTTVDPTITTSGGSNDMVSIYSGLYQLELSATDTDTIGNFSIIADASAVGAAPVFKQFNISANGSISLATSDVARSVMLATSQVGSATIPMASQVYTILNDIKFILEAR